MSLNCFRSSTLTLAVAAAFMLGGASARAQQDSYPSYQNGGQHNNGGVQQPSAYPNAGQQPSAYPNTGQQQNSYPNRDQRDQDRDRRDNSAMADNDTPHNWTTDQIITATVHQAWVLSGRNEANFFEIVRQLAEISARNRNLVLPDDPGAGRRAGEYIKQQARADHDQLLYAIVDKSVQMTGTKASAPGN